jgi:HemX protein
MIVLLHLASFALYGVAGALLGVSLARENRRLPAIAVLVITAGVVVHAWALLEFSARWEQLPLVGLGPSLSTLAFLVALSCLIAATFGHASSVGIVLVPVVALLMALSGIVGIAPTGEAPAFRGAWFVLHVVFAFVGYAGLTVAFAAGLMYLLQFRELKGKHFGPIFRFFPPLETLDRLGRHGLQIGFLFWTLAVLLAWAWTANFQGSAAPGQPKLALVVLSWIVFLSALLARAGRGRRGERSALASVIGFLVVVVLHVIIRAQAAKHGAFL